MPYSSLKELPAAVKKLPQKAQKAFKNAFNNAVRRGLSEQEAFKRAWAAAKNVSKTARKKTGDSSMRTCEHCDRSSFADEQALQAHLRVVHPNPDTQRVDETVYICQECDSYTTSVATMTHHYREQHDADRPATLALASRSDRDDQARSQASIELTHEMLDDIHRRRDQAKNYSAEERREMEKKGWAMSGGKFPIKDCGDVKDAISRLGNQKGLSNAAVKRHIKKRAQALGCSLPEGW